MALFWRYSFKVFTILPLIVVIWSSCIWFSTTTSRLGKSRMVGFMFFIRVAMPLNFWGIRLHIDIHWSSSSCWVNWLSVAMFFMLGSVGASIPGIREILFFLRRAISRTFFQERPISVVPPGVVDLSMGRLLGSYFALVAAGEASTLLLADGVTAAATCGAAVLGRDCPMRLWNRDFSLRGLRPATGVASSAWVICATSMRVSSTSRRLLPLVR